MKKIYFSVLIFAALLLPLSVLSGCVGCDQPEQARSYPELNFIQEPRGGQNVNTLTVRYQVSAYTDAQVDENGNYFMEEMKVVIKPPEVTVVTWWENNEGTVYEKSSRTFGFNKDRNFVSEEIVSTISAPAGKYYDKTFKFCYSLNGRMGSSRDAVCVVK